VVHLGETRLRRGREDALAVVTVLAGFVLLLLPGGVQASIRHVLRVSILSPFVSAQTALVRSRLERVSEIQLRAQRDSLLMLVAAERPLVEENRRLRALLALRQRAGASFVAGNVLHSGVASGENVFMLDVGRDRGVRVGDPVVTADGLLGVVVDVDGSSSQAMAWNHPDFRASAMSADGSAYGVAEPRPGEFAEEDELILTGAPFHSDLRPGTTIVTSGRGGIYPRGVPLGTVMGIGEADTGWRKSYLLRPAAQPGSATAVLVDIAGDSTADLSELWGLAGPPGGGRDARTEEVGRR
jgi:rod shape-determining protein MreC